MSDLFPSAQRGVNARREAALRGLDAPPERASWGDVIVGSVQRGAYAADEGLSRLGATLANIPNTAFETPSYFNQSEDRHRITDPSSYEQTDLSRWFEEQANVNRREIRRITPDPRSLTYAQQMVSGVLQPLTQGVIGAPLGPAGSALTLGAGFGTEAYHEQIDQGVDEETATRIGYEQAGYGALMGVLPAAAPIRGGRFAFWPVVGRAASGAAINVATGAAMRGSIGDRLREAGYEEQASRYNALDGQAMLADAILGAAFGTVFAHADSGGSAPQRRSRDAIEPEAPEIEPVQRFSADQHLDMATEAYEAGDLAQARAHALMADRLGEQEGAFLAEQWAQEGGQEAVVESDALSFAWAAERGMIRPTADQRDAAMVIQADRHARVDTAPGIPLDLEAEARHAESLARAERQFADGEEVDVGQVWDDYTSEQGFAPHDPARQVEAQSHAEAAIRQVLDEEGFPELAREVEEFRARVRSMGGEIGPDEALFSMGPGRRGRGVDAERRSDAFYNSQLSPQQNKAVEMLRNGFSGAEIADELGVQPKTVDTILSQARDRIGSLVPLRPRGQMGRPDARGYTSADLLRMNEEGGLTTRQIAEQTGVPHGSVKARLSQERARRRSDAPNADDPLFSQGAQEGFSTVAELEALARELGVGWDDLQRAANVRLVQASAEVPAPMGLPRGVNAVHMRDTRTTYFIANNIRPENLYGLILHEVGVHHGMPDMLGKRGFKEVLRQIDRMVEEEHPALVEARAFAERYAHNETQVPEETLAYLIETHADLPLVNRILSRLRQWLIKTFGSTFGMRLTVDDLRALAITSLRRVAEQARRESSEAVEVLPVQEAVYASQGPDAGARGGETVRFGDLSEADQRTLVQHMRNDPNGVQFLRSRELLDEKGRASPRTFEALADERLERRRVPLSGLQEEVMAREAPLEYAARQSDLPPILVQNGAIIDGNHRVAAARLRGASDLDAYDASRLYGETQTGRAPGYWTDSTGQLRYDPARNAPDGGSTGAGQFSWERGSQTAKIGDADLVYSVGPEGNITLNSIRVPENLRRGGQGRAAMEALLAEADRRGATVYLTPQFIMDGQPGAHYAPAMGNEALTKFYRSLGFRRNTGRNRDFSSTEEMLRLPRALPNAGAGDDFPLFSRGQNRSNLLGEKRDPIDEPNYQQRLRALRESDGGQGSSGEAEGGGAGSVRRVAGEPARSGRAGSDARSGEGTPGALRELLAVSGLRLVSKPNKGAIGNFGDYRAQIDTPFASDADNTLQAAQGADGGPTLIDFNLIDGSNPKETQLPGVHITMTRVNDGAKGAKVGIWLYRQIIDWADRQGLPVYSDTLSVSAEAQRVYGALERRGYQVERIAAVRRASDGSVMSTDGRPVYRVSIRDPDAITETLTGAPLPREDYQIDGPSLRERQQKIDEQRARQETYDKASPVEQVLMDEPDMMLTDPPEALFSIGPPRRRVRATEARANRVEELRQAIEMKKGYDAAVRCALRHGGSMAARSFVTLGGRGATQAAAAAQMAGMEYGLAASLPVAWGASHLAARGTDPEGYARNQARIAEGRVARAQARFEADANQAGRNAGLDAPTTYNDLQGEPLVDNIDMSRRSGDTAVEDVGTPWQEGPRELAGRGLEQGPWDEPNTATAPGGGRTREGGKVPPAPPSAGERQNDGAIDPARDLASHLNPIRRNEEQ